MDIEEAEAVSMVWEASSSLNSVKWITPDQAFRAGHREGLYGYWASAQQTNLTAAIPDHEVAAFLQVYGEEVCEGAGEVTHAIPGFSKSLHRWEKDLSQWMWSQVETSLTNRERQKKPWSRKNPRWSRLW